MLVSGTFKNRHIVDVPLQYKGVNVEKKTDNQFS